MINKIYHQIAKRTKSSVAKLNSTKSNRVEGFAKASLDTSLETPKKVSNISALQKQKTLLQMLVLGFFVIVAAIVIFAGEGPEENRQEKQENTDIDITELDLPDKNLNTEKRWRNHFERMRIEDRKEFNTKLEEMKKFQADSLKAANDNLQAELDTTKAKLDAASAELLDANGGLKRALQTEEQRRKAGNSHLESKLEAQEFGSDIEYDKPKSAANYVPEGTYFTGHLLGGVIVSTALNTPDENATPVVIRLKNGATNLSKMNKLDLSQCKIMGSAYGDLSSERAIVRLEKMICYKNGMYMTSKISGQLYGPDGYNGVKGTVVSTGIKHLKGAAIGGFISGVSGAASGESSHITIAGINPQKAPSGGQLLRSGALGGAKNVGEKIADYYLKQAESMFPVLTVPPGARVQAQITRGFHVGEVSTHKKIKSAKK